MNLGNAYGTKGNFDRALDNLNRAMQLKDNFAEAYNNRAALYAKNNHNNLAIADFNSAIHIKNDYAEAYLNRGTFTVTQGKLTLLSKTILKR